MPDESKGLVYGSHTEWALKLQASAATPGNEGISDSGPKGQKQETQRWVVGVHHRQRQVVRPDTPGLNELGGLARNGVV